jgi:hypothetical protein
MALLLCVQLHTRVFTKAQSALSALRYLYVLALCVASAM